jgi:FtsP/CotA-like multicopper oxidase with cupredoxin domain
VIKELKMSSIRDRIATTTVAALTTALAVAALTTGTAGASPVQAAGLVNCGATGATTPCFEKIWSDGKQVRMTFVNLNPAPSTAPTRNFYVLAPQTRTPQGTVPFLHDHVIGDVSPQDHGDARNNNLVRYHGYFVLCSAQGISSGGCVPSMTSIPGLGTIPFAKTVNGHKLTSAGPIESPENAGLLTIFDTGGVFIATIAAR